MTQLTKAMWSACRHHRCRTAAAAPNSHLTTLPHTLPSAPRAQTLVSPHSSYVARRCRNQCTTTCQYVKVPPPNLSCAASPNLRRPQVQHDPRARARASKEEEVTRAEVEKREAPPSPPLSSRSGPLFTASEEGGSCTRQCEPAPHLDFPISAPQAVQDAPTRCQASLAASWPPLRAYVAPSSKPPTEG